MKYIYSLLFILTFCCLSCGQQKVVVLSESESRSTFKLKIEYHHKLRDTIGYQIAEYNDVGNVIKYYGNIKTSDMNNNFVGYYFHDDNKIVHKLYNIEENINSFDSSRGMLIKNQDFLLNDSKQIRTVDKCINHSGHNVGLCYQDTSNENYEYLEYKYFNKLYKRKYRN
jgi:hypothetical protein